MPAPTTPNVRSRRQSGVGASTLRRATALLALVATPVLVVACSDDDTQDTPGSTIVENPNSTTTGVPQTSSSVPSPTSAPSGAPGQGTQVEQPGGTAQPLDPDATNTTQAP